MADWTRVLRSKRFWASLIALVAVTAIGLTGLVAADVGPISSAVQGLIDAILDALANEQERGQAWNCSFGSLNF